MDWEAIKEALVAIWNGIKEYIESENALEVNKMLAELFNELADDTINLLREIIDTFKGA